MNKLAIFLHETANPDRLRKDGRGISADEVGLQMDAPDQSARGETAVS